MKLLCLFLCVYLSILSTLKWFITDENFDGFTQFDGFTHMDTDEFTQSENIYTSVFKGYNRYN